MASYLYLSTNEFELRMMLLAQMVRMRTPTQQKPDIIIAIARGGLTIAHYLSDHLGLPVASFTVSSYKDLKRTDDLQMSFKIGGRLNGQNVLLVDDVSDSGKTFVRAVHYLKQVGARHVVTASLFVKPGTEFQPNHFVERTEAYIIFPWDLFESMKCLKDEWLAKGTPESALRVEFVRIGIPPNAITYFFSSYLVPVPGRSS